MSMSKSKSRFSAVCAGQKTKVTLPKGLRGTVLRWDAEVGSTVKTRQRIAVIRDRRSGRRSGILAPVMGKLSSIEVPVGDECSFERPIAFIMAVSSLAQLQHSKTDAAKSEVKMDSSGTKALSLDKPKAKSKGESKSEPESGVRSFAKVKATAVSSGSGPELERRRREQQLRHTLLEAQVSAKLKSLAKANSTLAAMASAKSTLSSLRLSVNEMKCVLNPKSSFTQLVSQKQRRELTRHLAKASGKLLLVVNLSTRTLFDWRPVAEVSSDGLEGDSLPFANEREPVFCVRSEDGERWLVKVRPYVETLLNALSQYFVIYGLCLTRSNCSNESAEGEEDTKAQPMEECRTVSSNPMAELSFVQTVVALLEQWSAQRIFQGGIVAVPVSSDGCNASLKPVFEHFGFDSTELSPMEEVKSGELPLIVFDCFVGETDDGNGTAAQRLAVSRWTAEEQSRVLFVGEYKSEALWRRSSPSPPTTFAQEKDNALLNCGNLLQCVHCVHSSLRREVSAIVRCLKRSLFFGCVLAFDNNTAATRPLFAVCGMYGAKCVDSLMTFGVTHLICSQPSTIASAQVLDTCRRRFPAVHCVHWSFVAASISCMRQLPTGDFPPISTASRRRQLRQHFEEQHSDTSSVFVGDFSLANLNTAVCFCEQFIEVADFSKLQMLKHSNAIAESSGKLEGESSDTRRIHKLELAPSICDASAAIVVKTALADVMNSASGMLALTNGTNDTAATAGLPQTGVCYNVPISIPKRRAVKRRRLPLADTRTHESAPKQSSSKRERSRRREVVRSRDRDIRRRDSRVVASFRDRSGERRHFRERQRRCLSSRSRDADRRRDTYSRSRSRQRRQRTEQRAVSWKVEKAKMKFENVCESYLLLKCKGKPEAWQPISGLLAHLESAMSEAELNTVKISSAWQCHELLLQCMASRIASQTIRGLPYVRFATGAAESGQRRAHSRDCDYRLPRHSEDWRFSEERVPFRTDTRLSSPLPTATGRREHSAMGGVFIRESTMRFGGPTPARRVHFERDSVAFYPPTVDTRTAEAYHRRLYGGVDSFEQRHCGAVAYDRSAFEERYARERDRQRRTERKMEEESRQSAVARRHPSEVVCKNWKNGACTSRMCKFFHPTLQNPQPRYRP